MQQRRVSSVLARPLILAVVVVLLIAAYFIFAGRVPMTEPELDSDSLARDRPTGAGTVPEGQADTLIDGPVVPTPAPQSEGAAAEDEPVPPSE